MPSTDDKTSPLLRAGRAAVPPGTPAWVTAELLENTRKIWQKRTTFPIGSEEALAIILRVGALIDVLRSENK
jgi:hypothetical protein